MLNLLQIELQIKWSVFTLLVCPSSCSSNLHAACLGALADCTTNDSPCHIHHTSCHVLAHLLGEWMDPQYLHVLTDLILFFVCTASTTCILMASSCFAHMRTWSLIISSILLMTLISLPVFLCMYLSLMPQINCSFPHLSSSSYLHYFAALLNL